MTRRMLAGLATAAALLFGTMPAQAGAVVLTSPNIELLQTLHADLAENFALDISPLLDPATLPQAETAECAPGEPMVHALLIGARDIYHNSLVGPENDIGLLTAAFAARAGDRADIRALVGDDVRREPLRAAMLDIVAELTCGDRVFLHFGGQSFPGRDMLEMVASAVFRGNDAVDIDAALSDRNALEAAAWDGRDDMLTLRDRPFVLVLNKDEDGRMEMVDGTDLSTFVTLVRNRGADIVVSLDSPFADRAAIARGQIAAGDSTLWALQSADRPATPVLPLVPGRGDFFAIYGAVGNFASIDRPFRSEDGTTTTYGAFTFEFAQVLQDPGAVTARLLGERIAAIPADRRARDGLYLVEGSDPNMMLFERDPTLELAETAIQITSPAPMRGPSAVESAVVEITGRVNWTTPPMGVMVQGKLATLGADGSFSYDAQLDTGLNRIEVVALTREQRILQRSIDIVYEGDLQALRGDGTSYLVTIANDAYSPATGFSPLATPAADADALRDLLAGTFGFVTEAALDTGETVDLTLRNASGRDIAMALYNVGRAAREADTVVIYYAGHGIYEPMTTTAFWVPVDALAGVPPTYLSASAISEAIARIPARKVVLISDSCFSGALMRGGPAETEAIDDSQRVNSLLALAKGRTRLLISSGNNEPVTDGGGSGHSIFARALLDGLAAMEHDQFSARELFDGHILQRVLANSRQEPQFRPLENVGHEGGDLVFTRLAG